MALTALHQAKISELLSLCDNGSSEIYSEAVIEAGLPTAYSTEMGRVVLAAMMEQAGKQMLEIETDWNQVCKKEGDPRCQIGHIESNLKSRLKEAQRAQNRGDAEVLAAAYQRFMRNANATTLIVDRKNIRIGERQKNKKRVIEGIKSRFAVDLSKIPGHNSSSPLQLCDDVIYANELVPDTDIYGSGHFIKQNVVVTAAHVLDEIFIAGAVPEDVLFIRGHYVWDTNKPTIEVSEDQIYVLNQQEILVQDRILNGYYIGDMAWVEVRPYYANNNYKIGPVMFNTNPLSTGQHMYALGHGLGIPMKLAFKGEVQDVEYNNSEYLFTCDLNILPGSSGAPIFDANTHELVGFVSGLHALFAQVSITGDCARLHLNMRGKYSGIATYFYPFQHLIQ